MKSDGFLQITKLVAIICHGLPEEWRKENHPTWSIVSASRRGFVTIFFSCSRILALWRWCNTLSPCHFLKNSVILQCLFCCSEHKLLQLVASKNSKVYNSSHAGMQHCKLGFGCSYHVSTEKVALIVIIGWGKLDERKIWSYWVYILFWLKPLWGHFRHCVSMNVKHHVNWP